MKVFFTIAMGVLLLCAPLKAGETASDSVSKSATKAAFSPKDVIFDHIRDSHEWHICTWKGKPVAIPLPVILYSKTSGFNIFSSEEFDNPTHSYKQFVMSEEVNTRSNISEILSDGTTVKPLDFSITRNVLTLFMVVVFMLWFFLSMARTYKKKQFGAPTGARSFFEPLILFVRDEIAISCIGPKKYEKYMPYLLTAFFFIWFLNMLGMVPLFPGGANVTGNIAVTLVLALFTFVITTAVSNKHYWKEIFNPDVPVFLKFPVPIMPLIEFAQVFIKPFVLMIRLFANVMAGHIMPLGFICLIFIFGQQNIFMGYGVSVFSVLFVVFLSLLELLVAFIQAYVFTLLSAIYIGMAMENPHETEEISK
jgi:F-type H+-transporting ATPase subunit a